MIIIAVTHADLKIKGGEKIEETRTETRAKRGTNDKIPRPRYPARAF